MKHKYLLSYEGLVTRTKHYLKQRTGLQLSDHLASLNLHVQHQSYVMACNAFIYSI